MTLASPSASTELFAERPLVGRREKLAELAVVLERPPALVVISGPRGSGRKALLDALARYARADRDRGWQVIGPWRLSRDDEARGIADALRKAADPTGRGVENRRLVDSHAGAADARARGSGLLAALATRPTLILWNGFGTSPELSEWIIDVLAADLRGAEAPVVIVVAGIPEGLAPATAAADLVVEIQAPTEAELREHLTAVGRSLDPPADPAEVETLAAGAAKSPQLVGPLLRALSYTRAR